MFAAHFLAAQVHPASWASGFLARLSCSDLTNWTRELGDATLLWEALHCLLLLEPLSAYRLALIIQTLSKTERF